MGKRASLRIERVQTPMIPVVGEWIAQHPGTISLGQGIVHFAPPPEVRTAVSDAIQDEARIDRYCLVRGIDEFLAQVHDKLVTENGLNLASSSLVITAGSNMGFLNAVLAIGDVGDEIILLSPYYFNHEMAIEIAGCQAVIVPTDSQYQLDMAAIEAAITDRTRAVVTVSPSNPTGAVYSARSLTAVNNLCRARGVYHISDEAYEYFVYGSESHFSAGSLPNAAGHTISLYSLSKAYGMAGWRTAYMTVPKELETAVKKIQDTNLVCPPVLNQIAAVAALRAGAAWCREQIKGFARVRDLVLDELDSLGPLCEVPRPDGAFYVLAKIHAERADIDLVEALIRDFGIAVMPGSTFGVAEGCALRIAYGALDAETVAQGMGRLVKGLRRLV